MLFKKELCAFALIAATTAPCKAADFQFSVGAGYPFFIVPEVAVLTRDNQQKWTLNYKAGLDDGFSLAYEHSVAANNKHAIGLVGGTIGVIDDEPTCNELDTAVACIVASIFDEESVDGVAASYSYYFNNMSSSSTFMKVEAGWGKSRDTEQSETVASIRIGYQF